MLTIRLSRIGKKNKPMFRLIISEKARDTQGRALEILGSYNPYTKELKAKGERIKYWLSKGSGSSPTVNNLLIENNIIKGEKVKASTARKKKKTDKQAGQKSEKTEEKPKETSKEDKKDDETKDEIKNETKKEETENTAEKAKKETAKN